MDDYEFGKLIHTDNDGLAGTQKPMGEGAEMNAQVSARLGIKLVWP